MKNVLKFCCILAALFCVAFPAFYFHSAGDVKEIRISHVLLESQEEAVTVLEEIRGGLGFSKAVQKYSKDKMTNEKDGVLGYYSKYNILEPSISDAAFKLKKYEISEPVESSYGVHLIRVSDIVYFSDRKNFDERY